MVAPDPGVVKCRKGREAKALGQGVELRRCARRREIVVELLEERWPEVVGFTRKVGFVNDEAVEARVHESLRLREDVVLPVGVEQRVGTGITALWNNLTRFDAGVAVRIEDHGALQLRRRRVDLLPQPDLRGRARHADALAVCAFSHETDPIAPVRPKAEGHESSRSGPSGGHVGVVGVDLVTAVATREQTTAWVVPDTDVANPRRLTRLCGPRHRGDAQREKHEAHEHSKASENGRPPVATQILVVRAKLSGGIDSQIDTATSGPDPTGDEAALIAQGRFHLQKGEHQAADGSAAIMLKPCESVKDTAGRRPLLRKSAGRAREASVLFVSQVGTVCRPPIGDRPDRRADAESCRKPIGS
jgi:hypothetical protein